MKKLLIISLIFCSLTSCIEEIDLNNFANESILIVEARLTNEYQKHTVKLSKTIPLDAENTEIESNAIVRIEDSSNNVFSFSETTPGIYTSDNQFKAELTDSYVLTVNTSDGEIYTSSAQKIEGINTIDKITSEVAVNAYGEEGVSIVVSSESANKDANYYRYTYEETYKIIPPYWSNQTLKIIRDTKPFIVTRPDDLDAINGKECYNTIKSISLIQTETKSLSVNSVNYSIRFIPEYDPIIRHRYSILVNQYVQSHEAYTYFKTLDKLSTNENVFTQVQTGFFQGNLTSKNDSKKRVIGFFEVSSISKKRIFFNFFDLFTKYSRKPIDDCHVEAPKLYDSDEDPESPLILALRVRKLVYARDNEYRTDMFPGPYRLTTIDCTDCRYTEGSNIKPTFWID